MISQNSTLVSVEIKFGSIFVVPFVASFFHPVAANVRTISWSFFDLGRLVPSQQSCFISWCTLLDGFLFCFWIMFFWLLTLLLYISTLVTSLSKMIHDSPKKKKFELAADYPIIRVASAELQWLVGTCCSSASSTCYCRIICLWLLMFFLGLIFCSRISLLPFIDHYFLRHKQGVLRNPGSDCREIGWLGRGLCSALRC
jgi:hypothetical protein